MNHLLVAINSCLFVIIISSKVTRMINTGFTIKEEEEVKLEYDNKYSKQQPEN